jgi:putative sterol carrier protein
VTVNEIFQQMRDKVMSDPAKVASMQGSYLFELTGDGGGVYHAAFDHGAVDIAAGPIASPGCTVTMSAADFMALVDGKLNAMAAFMGGKLKVKGDMGLAMKLQSVLS